MAKSIQILIPIYFAAPELFNTIEMCLSSLKTCYPDIEVLTYDDGSPLDCPDYWNITEYGAVNLGYTAAVNKLLSMSTADVIIVCNDDVTFWPGCFDRFFDLPDMVIASPSDTASGDLESFGCCFGMTRNTFDKLGLLDERFKHFYSDTEYMQRAKEAGVEVIKWHDILLNHSESTTYKVLGNKDQLLAEDAAQLSA